MHMDVSAGEDDPAHGMPVQSFHQFRDRLAFDIDFADNVHLQELIRSQRLAKRLDVAGSSRQEHRLAVVIAFGASPRAQQGQVLARTEEKPGQEHEKQGHGPAGNVEAEKDDAAADQQPEPERSLGHLAKRPERILVQRMLVVAL